MNQFVKPIPAKNVPRVVAAAVWLCAIGAPVFAIHTNLVEAARREAQVDVITQVAATIKSGATSRDEVMWTLAQHERQASDARYLRAANRLGVPMDWKALFSQIRKRKGAEQNKAAQIIAEECGLAPDSTLKSEQSYLVDRANMVAAPVSIVMPPISARVN